MVNFHIVIPARYGSTRLPQKLLLPLAGKPVLQHVYEKACLTKAQSITIATDNEEIYNVMSAQGAKVLMTNPNHPNGTSRLAEAITQLKLSDQEVIVNVQGDEPLLPAELIHQVASNLSANPLASMATLCEPIDSADIFNPNTVKVVTDEAGFALYFSRAPIPYQREGFAPNQQLTVNYHSNMMFRHIGLYAYRVSFLKDYPSLAPTTLEKLEMLEQLRVLYYGYKIHVAESSVNCPGGIDTAEDLEKIRQLFN